MAALWAKQIIAGKKIYDQVPRLLKDKVREILIELEYGHLVVD